MMKNNRKCVYHFFCRGNAHHYLFAADYDFKLILLYTVSSTYVSF